MPIFRSARGIALAALLAVGACAPTPAAPSPSPGTTTAPSTSEAAGPTTPPGCASLEAPANEGRAHLPDGETASYGSYPPTSGPHWVTPAAPGWYDEAPPVEQLVHSLEHGFVVVYRSGLDAPDEAALRARFDDLVIEGFGGLISVPDPSIKDPMTLTAWGRLQRCVRAEPDAFEAFVRAHYAEAPEATAACGFAGAALLPACEALLAGGSPGPSRSPTAAEAALLARVPDALRADCRPTTTLAEGADAGWDCAPAAGDLVYGYASFPTPAARDAYFDGIVRALGPTPDGDCATSSTGLGRFTRDDGTAGRLACAETGNTRAYYWTVDGTSDLGAVLGLGDADLQTFWESAGPKPLP